MSESSAFKESENISNLELKQKQQNFCLQRSFFITLIGAIAILTTIQTFYLIQMFCRRFEEIDFSDETSSNFKEPIKCHHLREQNKQRTYSTEGSIKSQSITDFELSSASLPLNSSLEAYKSKLFFFSI